jgi:hypothetical protein
VIPPVHTLLEIKFLNRGSVLAVGKAHQHMRQAEADVSRIVALAEHVPFHVRRIVKDLFQIAGARKFGEALEIEHRRSSSGDKRRVGGGGHAGHFFEQRDVLRMTPKLVVSD